MKRFQWSPVGGNVHRGTGRGYDEIIIGLLNDLFGIRVGISGDYILVSAVDANAGPASVPGCGYLLKRYYTPISESFIWLCVYKFENHGVHDPYGKFGNAVAIDGYNLVLTLKTLLPGIQSQVQFYNIE